MAGSLLRERIVVGRYALHDLIAAGGMGRVYLGRALGAAGFSRTVAIKRLHPNLANEPQFVAMLLDEARISSRIHHPNVVSVLDVVDEGGEFLLVMEHVPGASLHMLVTKARKERVDVPPEVVAAVFSGILRGLHAAHEATNEASEPLHIVHRDVSPQNVLVSDAGLVKVLDFGIAKAQERLVATQSHSSKGKPAYMAPEQLACKPVDRRADIYAVGVMLWETIAGQRLFTSERNAVVPGAIPALATISQSSAALCFGAIAERALRDAPADRFATAAEMADAIEAQAEVAAPVVVGAWAMTLAPDWLGNQRALVASLRDPAEPDRETTTTSFESTPPRRKRKRGRSRMGVALGIGAGVLAVAAIGAGVHFRSSSTTATPAPAPSTDVAGPSATIAPAAPIASVAAVEAAATNAAPTPSALPSAGPVRATLAPAGRASTPRPRPASKPTPNCSPPFTVDERGTKIPKRECL